MKMPQQSSKQQLQELLDQQQHLEGDIRAIQKQIQELQVHYLQKSWPDGNIYMGWNKNLTSSQISGNKIHINPKQKIFSLSSTTSDVQLQIVDMADRNLSPWGEHRFQSVRKKHKINKAAQIRRVKSLRRKKKK